MERKVADDITIECLFEKNPNGNFYSQVFEEYLEILLKKNHIIVQFIH